MKFQTKLFFSFGILILMLFVLTGLSINLIGNIKDEVNTTALVYFPIQDEAFTLRGYIFNISGAVNFYLNTNSKEEWSKVETLLAKLSTVMINLTHSIEKTGRPEKSDQMRQIDIVLKDYEKNLRDMHAHNETFIAIREKMLAEANAIAATTIAMVTYYTKKLEQTARSGGLQEIQQVRFLSDLAIRMNTSIGFIRINMLRSLTEQNFIYVEKSFKEHFPAMLKTLNEIPSYMDLPEDKEKTLLLRQKVESFKNIQQTIVLQWKQRNALEKERNALQVKAIAQSGAIAEDSTVMQSQSMDKVTNVVERAISLSLIISGIALIIGITVAFFLIRNVLRQLGKDPGELGNIAQRVTQGDYAVDDGSPKIGVFGNIIAMVTALRQNIDKARHESERAAEESNKTRAAMEQAEKARMEAQSKTESMLDIADRLEQMADIVSSASTDLSIQIGQSEHGATEQAARVAETATAIEEMNSTVLEVAQNAGSASDISVQTRQKADNGAKIVKKAVNAIQHVQQQSLALKEDMAALSGHAQSISQIMNVISDIADQTNLLALNAAIEAARAGEAGRGFAVVADEVRKLAEKTMASTTDVGKAISSIQESADNNMRQVDKAVQMIEEATGYANQSGEALTEIVGMVDQTADQVRAIATASEQQSTSSEKINQSIAQVRNIADETAQAMAEATKAMSDLVRQAQVLTTLIENLKHS